MTLNPNARRPRRLAAAISLLVALGLLAGCGGEDSLSGGAGAGPGGSSTTSSGGAGGAGGGSGGAGGAGGSGGSGGVGGSTSDVTCETIVDELKANLDATLMARAAGEGWPAPAANGFLFVSTDPALDKVAGDHDNWTGTAMNGEGGFRWACLKVAPGSHYKLTNLSQWQADPWARSYTYDNFGEMSLVKPTEGHLDRHISVGDAEMEPRTVRVWVPEGGYDRVLYVHDGQNLFNPEAFFGGWKLQESAPTGILLVGIDNTPARMDEYTHNQDFVLGKLQGGKGDAYADFLKQTVRPLIQKHYGEKGPIGVMGSSLGGLISFHIADRHPGDYAFAASLSGTMGWGSIGANNETMIERYQKSGHQSTFLYLDSGGGGDTCADSDMDGTNDDDMNAGDNYCENIQMRDVLLSIGYSYDKDLAHWHEPDAPHNEAAWAARVFRPLDIFRGL
jgi:predicted alpha/beta superfamily hydrolase